MKPDELDDLIFRYFAGALNQQDQQLLERLLESNPDCGRRFAELSLQETLLEGMGEAESDHALVGDSTKNLTAAQSRRMTFRPKRKNRNRIQPYFFVGGLAAAAVAIAAIAHFYNAAQLEKVRATQTATVIEIRGTATVQSGASSIQVRSGIQVAPGEMLKVAPDSSVRVKYPDNTVLDVAAGSELALLQLFESGGKALRLELGRIDANVTHQPESPLTIETPGTQVRVVGTKFSLGVNAGLTRLEVQEGRVALTRVSDRKTVEVGVGEYVESETGSSLVVSKVQKSPKLPEVVSFTLINADTDQPVAGFDPIQDGIVIALSKLPTQRLSIRANCEPAVVPSIHFTIDGIPNKFWGNKPPYSAFGDSDGKFWPWVPTVGKHSISARAFSQQNAKGVPGKSLIVRFEFKP